MYKWFEEIGKESDVVISSRVRLARNLKEYPFSVRLNTEQSQELIEKAEKLAPYLSDKMNQNFYYCRFDTLKDIDKLALVERHVVSPAFASKKVPEGILLSDDEAVSIMINEEDHIRIQAIATGMNMETVWERASRIDDITYEQLHYAFDKQFGYLTACPTNTGTGLRASYMMFLPALTAGDKIRQLGEEMAQYGITIRGIYGEGTSAVGNIYQISNQRTLGNSEQEIMDNLNRIVLQVIAQERNRRKLLIESHYDELEDQVHRSYGVLKYATQMSSSDAVTLLSQLKLGVDCGILKLAEPFSFYNMIIAIQRANLLVGLGKNIGNAQRDKCRAEYLRENLPKLIR